MSPLCQNRFCGLPIQIPCLNDPATRSALSMRVALVVLHFVYIGVLFLFDKDLIEKTKIQPWYTALYLLLFFVTLIQYFFAACTSPGYVWDAVRAFREENAKFLNRSEQSQHASKNNGNVVITVDHNESSKNLFGYEPTSWSKMVLDLYPPGTNPRSIICSYCSIEQPPRAKHCYECNRCVLQFDHHCSWLGSCVGQGNHCRFWWYILGETALCLWTSILYISYLKKNILYSWWKDVIMIPLLIFVLISTIFLVLLLFFHSYLISTNQTTYELVRRKRIPYLRDIPARVFPFSQGILWNLYNFCCSCTRSSIYDVERLPTAAELEERSKASACFCCCGN